MKPLIILNVENLLWIMLFIIISYKIDSLFLSLSWCWYVTCYTRLHMFGCISTPFVSNYLELKRNRSWNMRSYVKKYIFVLLDIQHYNWKCTHMCRFISIYDYVSEYKVFNWIKMWMMKPTWPHFIICWYITSVYFQ